MQTERTEYAARRRRGSALRLVKLPGESGFTKRDESAEMIAKRLRVEAAERRAARDSRK